MRFLEKESGKPEPARGGQALTPETFFFLFHHLNLTRPPGLVEPGLLWAVQTQNRAPASAGHGLYPVGLLAGRGFRAEINVR